MGELARQRETNQFQYGDLHHTLVKVSGLVFHNFHRHHLVRFHVLALDNLSKRALSKNVKNQVSGTRSG
jgi:hypothetical protein